MAGLELIQHQQVGSGGVATVTFSSIPGTYRHLLLKGHTRSERNSATDGSAVRFNDDSSASNYWQVQMGAGGNALTTYEALSGTDNAINFSMDAIGVRDQTDAFATAELWILDYAATDKYKGVIGGSSPTGSAGDTNDYAQHYVHAHWLSTSAITKLAVLNGVGDWAEHTVFSLYGLNSAD